MSQIMPYFIPVGLAVVTIVLLLGLFNMLKDGSSSRSQKLMRLRVGLQFIVIVVIMTMLYFSVKS